MNKNSGFTLFELICVVLLIGLITALVSIPVNKFIKDSREELYESQKQQIILAAQNWAIDNPYSLPLGNDEFNITIEELLNEGYLDTNVINMVDDEEIKVCSYIKITLNTNSIDSNKNNYNYQYVELENC